MTGSTPAYRQQIHKGCGGRIIAMVLDGRSSRVLIMACDRCNCYWNLVTEGSPARVAVSHEWRGVDDEDQQQ